MTSTMPGDENLYCSLTKFPVKRLNNYTDVTSSFQLTPNSKCKYNTHSQENWIVSSTLPIRTRRRKFYKVKHWIPLGLSIYIFFLKKKKLLNLFEFYIFDRPPLILLYVWKNFNEFCDQFLMFKRCRFQQLWSLTTRFNWVCLHYLNYIPTYLDW